MKDSLKYYKIKKQGNSLTISINKDAEIKEGQLYSLEINSAGQLIYTPVESPTNIWDTEEAQNHNFQKDLKEIGFNVGNESSKGQEGAEYCSSLSNPVDR